MDTKTEQLRRLPCFTPLDDGTLAVVAEATHEVSFAPGTRFITEGQIDDDVFFIVDGSAEVTFHGRKIRTLTAGDVVGEMAAATFGSRTASVTAVTHVRALIMTGEFLRDLLQQHPNVAAVLSREMSFRSFG